MIKEILPGFDNVFDSGSSRDKVILSHILLKTDKDEKFLYNLYWMGEKSQIASDDWYEKLKSTSMFLEPFENEKYVLSIFEEFVIPGEEKYKEIRDSFRAFFSNSDWKSKVNDNGTKYIILEDLTLEDLMRIMEDSNFQSLRSPYMKGLFSVYRQSRSQLVKEG